MPNAAPYKILKRGDQFVVVNNAGQTKATFKDRAKALDYMRALYSQVPGAAKKADKTPWTGKAKPPVKAILEQSADDVYADMMRFGEEWAPTMPPGEVAKAAFLAAEDRRKMAKSGVALSDGSFPIPDESHLRSAVKLARTPAHRAHIKKRAKALGKTHLLPSDW
jgi:U3 small nucleolar ribonucleoprotein component